MKPTLQLLALILTLALAACSNETQHDSRDGQTQDGGVGGQYGGRADGN